MEKETLDQLEIIDVTFLPFNLKIFVSFKYYRLYSYRYEDEGMEKGALDQLEIIDLRFCLWIWKLLFPSNIDYTRKSIIFVSLLFIYPTEGEKKEF